MRRNVIDFLTTIEEMQKKLKEMSRVADEKIEVFANNSLDSKEEDVSRDLIAKLMEVSLDMLHMDKKLESLKS
jgi:hypothetical protein